MSDIPPLVDVSSGTIAAVGYDEAAALLYVQFTDGSLYEYLNVPSPIHDGLMEATSHGRYFDASIRPHYSYRKVN